MASTFHISVNYNTIPDRQLVGMILDGNEDAGIFFVYVKYDKDIDYFTIRYYKNLEFKDDLTSYLYIHIRGKDGQWKPLKTFQWRCSLRTWFTSVASHLFLEKRKELIGLGDYSKSIDTPEGEEVTRRLMQDKEENTNLVILMEAINRLKNDEYRFILIKEIEGYKPKEIAELLVLKRKQENKMKEHSDGSEIIPDAPYIHMIKHRYKGKLKAMVEQVKKEWYGNK